MEVILDCYFHKVFSNLDRGCLMARYKRQQVVDYFSTVIAGCAKGEIDCDPQSGCNRAVQAAINFHRKTKGNNGEVCLLGKYHNILYVAVRLCYDWKLEDNNTVTDLLHEIYSCEKTFERLMMGAIFGTKATQLISGWKSDFNNHNESISAIKYFLDHAAKGNLMFSYKNKLKCMAEIPMESYNHSTPSKVSAQVGKWDVLGILIKYGGGILHKKLEHCGLKLLLLHLQKTIEEYPDKKLPEESIKCLNVYIKGLPRIPQVIEDPRTDTEPIIFNLSILSSIPYDRTGYHPPSLKHLSRCFIRYRLAINGQLPYGVKKLDLPKPLQDYVNLEGEL